MGSGYQHKIRDEQLKRDNGHHTDSGRRHRDKAAVTDTRICSSEIAGSNLGPDLGHTDGDFSRFYSAK
jgi:hypothetical protein